MEDEFIGCIVKQLPEDRQVEAARIAKDYNPANSPAPEAVWAAIVFSQTMLAGIPGGVAVDTMLFNDSILTPGHLAVMTTKYWGTRGVRLTVGFPFDSAPSDLQRKIVQYMNEWGKFCNAQFVLTATDPQIRITRAQEGYWSYIGTDILSIPKSEPTMCLQGFTMATTDSEFMRVVPHETGHSMGFPHEHMRGELVSRLDRAKTIAYFQQYQGWSAQVTQQQVLTPLSEASLMSDPHADQDSIMCYQLPGRITTDGLPIRGGVKINDADGQWANKLYPKPEVPPTVAPPVASGKVVVDMDAKTVTIPGGWKAQ